MYAWYQVPGMFMPVVYIYLRIHEHIPDTTGVFRYHSVQLYVYKNFIPPTDQADHTDHDLSIYCR